MLIKQLTLKLTFYKAAVHHVEEDRHHNVQQLALLCHVPSQLLVAEELDADMYNAVRHGVRLVAFHQRCHDECIMLNKCFCESDLPDEKSKRKDRYTIRACCHNAAAFKDAFIYFQCLI